MADTDAVNFAGHPGRVFGALPSAEFVRMAAGALRRIMKLQLGLPHSDVFRPGHVPGEEDVPRAGRNRDV